MGRHPGGFPLSLPVPLDIEAQEAFMFEKTQNSEGIIVKLRKRSNKIKEKHRSMLVRTVT